MSRLNERDTAYRYSMGITGSGLFYLLRAAPGAPAEKIGGEYELDAFVEFVNKTGPQKKQKISRHDAAFEKQLAGKNRGQT
ncbi:MAG TPA: hypothetical protein VEC01_05610 [Noviherbaspirillum sp.]|uniref:hypothetical protein n=1 Tax=Noviherbaspirillum sp. TaxID=1926288 RepID=UPI002D70FAC5|nr:hypothetical protein [Noviherbaspirillum sp.]HYD94782.1 hypothetical protein [Noviherbaspirillum sp.]